MQQVKLDFFGSHSSESLATRIKDERAERLERAKSNLCYGISYMDDALGSIARDIVLVGAYSGCGKTELITHIAQTNVKRGKRVHVFALEAERNEIERRIKYKVIADFYYRGLRKNIFQPITIDYADWNAGKLDHIFGMYEPEIEDQIASEYKTLHTIYREYGEYTVDTFEKQFMAIRDQTDLVIVDHLHYFDLDDDNENRAIKNVVKKIRDTSLLSGKPVILVAHVRKRDRKYRSLLPELDDFMGSSDIGKIATRAVMIAPANVPGRTLTKFPTFIRVVKNRAGSSRTRLCALTSFDITTNRYQEDYYLGAENDEHEFEPITVKEQLPHWAIGASPYDEKKAVVRDH